MDEETLIFEMEESQKYLAALTGQVPYAVCYPEGTRSELSIEVAGRYYAYGPVSYTHLDVYKRQV